MEKFTEGEWLAWESHDDEDFAPRRDDCVIIGMGSYNENPYGHYTFHKIVINGESGDEEMIANANLIAAAPKAYYKLKEVEQYLDAMVGEPSYSKTLHDEIINLLAECRGEHEQVK